MYVVIVIVWYSVQVLVDCKKLCVFIVQNGEKKRKRKKIKVVKSFVNVGFFVILFIYID